ncbi:MAG: sugar phosphate isomerase/epimerase family protein [Gemmataceae bacterium]
MGAPPPDRRQFLLAGAAALVRPGKRPALGVVIHSYGVRSRVSRNRGERPTFADPLTFLDHCRSLGADGVQVGLGVPSKEDAARLRKRLDDTGMFVEGIVRLPSGKGDADRFLAELRAAGDLGATVLRTVCLSSRRYETFATAEAFRDFVKKSRASLELAEPLAAKAGVRLAVENHKDWRIDEFLDLLRRLSSEHVGVCVDTGNSIALLEEPHAVVEAYAPYAITTHFKDMAVAECDDGFLLSEVPFGTGFLDLAKVVKVLRAKRPDVRFNVEMITRDPLRVPCLSPGYWVTLDRVPGRELADALARVRKHAWKKPLPRLTGLGEGQLVRAEEDNVVQSLNYARKNLGL